MTSAWRNRSAWSGTVLVALALPVQAGTMLDRTRVIFPEAQKEVSLVVVNDEPRPFLLQSWIDDGAQGATVETSDVPFAVLPPLSRVDADAQQVLRIRSLPATLPTDRESLFWFNVLSIPGENVRRPPTTGTLDLSVLTRVKLLWRPQGLAGSADAAARSLRWRWQLTAGAACALDIENASAFHVTLLDVRLGSDVVSSGSQVVAPASRLPLTVRCRVAPERVTFVTLDDQGVERTHTAGISQ